jgi:hypothetical protein
MLASAVACSADKRPGDNRPPAPDSCADATNPLDKALCPELFEKDYQPLLANDQEVCSRLFVDMLGVRPTPDVLRRECIGKSLDEVLVVVQKNESYRKAQRRRWADRLSYSDAVVDALAIRDLDDLVDQLYQEKISYKDFAINALSHPGFVGRHNGYGQPELVAQAAFKAFLGRPPTRPEMFDLSNLWRPWQPYYFGFDMGGRAEGDAAVGPGYGMGVVIDPNICAAGVQVCESYLLGYAAIEFPANGRTQQIQVTELTPDDWHALRAPGRLFVELDQFWEAGVDYVLKQYLGYDLGALRPRARQALVDQFKNSGGNIPALERLIVGSWAYRQTAGEVDGTPRPDEVKALPFAYGPTKLMLAETWLQSIAAVTGNDLGECDWRYPNLPDYPVSPQVQALLGDYYPRDLTGAIDRRFRDMARSVGGCPGSFDQGSFTVSERSTHIGLITAVAQEEALVNICFLLNTPALIPDGMSRTDRSEAAIEGTVRHFLGRVQNNVNNDEVTEALTVIRSECTDCDVEATARGLCSGLLGGIEFMTY